jgi:hypothetical protein
MRPAVPFVVAAFIALLAIVASAAPAFHAGVADPNDTRGRLDVRRVRLAHRGSTEVTVITFASWSPSAIWDRGKSSTSHALVTTDRAPETRNDRATPNVPSPR